MVWQRLGCNMSRFQFHFNNNNKKSSFIYASASVFVNYKIAAMHARADDCNNATWCDDYKFINYTIPHIRNWTYQDPRIANAKSTGSFGVRAETVNDQKKMFSGSRTEYEAGADHWACDRSRYADHWLTQYTHPNLFSWTATLKVCCVFNICFFCDPNPIDTNGLHGNTDPDTN